VLLLQARSDALPKTKMKTQNELTLHRKRLSL